MRSRGRVTSHRLFADLPSGLIGLPTEFPLTKGRLARLSLVGGIGASGGASLGAILGMLTEPAPSEPLQPGAMANTSIAKVSPAFALERRPMIGLLEPRGIKLLRTTASTTVVRFDRPKDSYLDSPVAGVSAIKTFTEAGEARSREEGPLAQVFQQTSHEQTDCRELGSKLNIPTHNVNPPQAAAFNFGKRQWMVFAQE